MLSIWARAAKLEPGTTDNEALFVDDTMEEATRAREMGFASFFLDRDGEKIRMDNK